MSVTVVRTAAAMRALALGWRQAGQTVGVVPTMGALHAGHASLVRAARADCARVVVTIFVNPAQFDRAEDLARYPRTEAADLALLAPLGVDAVLAPPAAEVYPEGFATQVRVGGPADRLEGQHRPGHFDGVATVVTKLFGMTAAGRAYFGEKDWQQLQVVRRLAADLDLGVEVVACPTVREADGLALSSRNARLSPAARQVAAALPRVMSAVAAAIRAGMAVPGALAVGRQDLAAAGFEKVDYLELCDERTLEPLEAPRGGARLLAAAWAGGVRLIDNIAVAAAEPGARGRPAPSRSPGSISGMMKGRGAFPR
ncbi:MAG: pantoate--beta-alanine ligase [Rhodobacteraceae bacterium]|nr:pantoate--beta-alanine ligase [Paracoccaceae bacterium]